MASGHPDFYRGVVSYGNYAGEPKVLAVDSGGNLLCLVKGEYSGSLKNVAVDTNGQLLVNINANNAIGTQLISVGDLETEYSNHTIVAANEYYTVINIAEKCNILNLFLYSQSVGAGTAYNDLIRIKVNGFLTWVFSAADLYAMRRKSVSPGGLDLTFFDETNKKSAIELTGIIACSESFSVEINPLTANDHKITWIIIYGIP